MRLLHVNTLAFKDFVGDDRPKYAIISHRWTEEEVTYQQFLDGRRNFGNDKGYGWIKILKACEIAQKHDLKWIWIDTICIDKKSSAELSEAINSMFSWYSESAFCFVFLPDVHSFNSCLCGSSCEAPIHEGTLTHVPGNNVHSSTKDAHVRFYAENFKASVWFTRAWTLQELLAPVAAIFFNCEFAVLGERNRLAKLISEATKTPRVYLTQHSVGQEYDWKHFREASVAERMKWTSSRNATRKEDVAYSLLGLFDVNMPLLYGEGSRAFLQLQNEIIARSDDESIFAWFGVGQGIMEELRGNIGTPLPVVADEVREFSKGNLLETHRYIPRHQYVMTNKGIRFHLPLSKSKLFDAIKARGYIDVLMPLNCKAVIPRRNGTKTEFPVGITIRVKGDSEGSLLEVHTVLNGERHGSLKIGSPVASATSTYEAGIFESWDTKLVEPSPVNPRFSFSDIKSLSWFSSYTDRKSEHHLIVGDFDGTEVSYPVYLRQEDRRAGFKKQLIRSRRE